MNNSASLENIKSYLLGLQENICSFLEKQDGKSTFLTEKWEREEGGGGITKVIQNGNLIEKGGVNFSHVHGQLPQNIAEKLKVPNGIFHATGVSLVLHAQNPFVPIIHMNVRYFELENGEYWFGGGIDVTPIYFDENAVINFHKHLKSVCDLTDNQYYTEFKSWCDRYFFIKHRNETRGIGGLFYDRLNENSRGKSKENLFEFMQNVGNSFNDCYSFFLNDRNKPFGEKEKLFQSVRRSRYVEFNLVYDAGTKFGLDTQGRIESILMSMPPMAQWIYNFQPEPNSMEELMMSKLKPIDWI